MSINQFVPVGCKLAAITPSDSVDVRCAAVYVGGAGNLAVIGYDDTAAVTLSAIPAGTFLPIACSKIMSTNTTATLIVAIYV
jgi:hypothetical protein